MADYKNCNPSSKPRGSISIGFIGIAVLIAVFGWMGERDREHLEEIALQRHMIDGLVSMCPVIYDSSPELEMSMPIGKNES